MSTLPPLAQLEEMELRLGVEPGDLPTLDAARAEAALRDASGLVRATSGRSWTNDAGELLATLPSAIVTVTLNAALRGYRNPAGLKGRTQGSYSEQFGNDLGGVYLTAEEKTTVEQASRAAVGTGPRRVIRTLQGVRPHGQTHHVPTIVNGVLGGDPLPWEQTAP